MSAAIDQPTSTQAPTAIPSLPVTPTPTFAFTSRPMAIPTDQLVLYQTDFENNDASLSNWRSFAYSFQSHAVGTEGYTVSTNTSFYRFTAPETNQRIFSIYEADPGADVDISLHATAPYYKGSVGLICRYAEAGWYQFMVEPNGIWSIRLVQYDESGQLHFRKISSGIRWLGQNVDLRAECKGDSLAFYIDGERQALLHDDTFMRGKVGVLSWSFEQTGQVGFIDNFTVQQGQWSESTAPGPAPTPGPDVVIYTTNFEQLDALSQYWFTFPRIEILGPGVSRKTNYYINDFDPATGDVSISADLAAGAATRGLVCRYSVDGWYEAVYGLTPGGTYLSLARMEHNANGELTTTWLGSTPLDPASVSKLSLTCTGDRLIASVNDEPSVLAQDSLWHSGRYGFSVVGDSGVSPKTAFRSYTVLPADASIADTPPEIMETFLPVPDPGVYTEDNSLRVSAKNDVRFDGAISSENSELTLDMKFLTEGGLVIGCRNNNASLRAFEIHSNGDWIFEAANGNSAAIHPNANEITLRCVGAHITLTANGETVADSELPGYVPAEGKPIFYIQKNTTVQLDRIMFKPLQGSYVPPAAALPNQVSIPIYEPGKAIYKLQSASGWWDQDAANWQGLSGGVKRPAKGTEPESIVVEASENITAWAYRPDLYDLPVELTVDTTFTGKTGALGLMCRLTQIGRYEFMIQPDGSWSIRRNISEWFAPKAANIAVLAHGTSSAIQPTSNQISVVCQGNELVFSANGTELGRVQDDLYPEGQVGILFDKYTAGSFINLSVTRAP